MIFEQRKLERVDFGIRHLVVADLDHRFSVETLVDNVTRELVVKVRGYMWSERLDYKRVSHPENWWQAFKERWFPGWILEKFPVRYTVHTFDMRVLYPDFVPVTPEHVPYMIYDEFKETIDDKKV